MQERADTRDGALACRIKAAESGPRARPVYVRSGRSHRLGVHLEAGDPPADCEETQPPAKLPPAVLVFRDGHQEEAAKYTIVGSTIFIKTDYWSSGSWTHEVPIVQLDIPATLDANQARGTKFSLPSRPGEVMMRP